ncbi:MAG: hypothetical protein Q9Q13_05975 [Acidobacteriota bacterium]|nr:hypothetical protein [Acidobacteriota bacterium]
MKIKRGPRRDFKQAAADLDGLENIMREVEAIQYGLWTNGLEFFFLEKERKRFETKCNPIGDWPMAEESIGTKDVVSDAHTRVADNEMLKVTFRRCHNFIHGSRECRRCRLLAVPLSHILQDARRKPSSKNSVRPGGVVSGAGPGNSSKTKYKEIRKRIDGLFSEVKKQYKNIFRGNEEIALSGPAPWRFIVSGAGQVRLHSHRRVVRLRGVAYQEIVVHEPTAVTGASISRLAVW